MLVAMTSPDNRGYDTDLLEALSQRVMVGDGAIGTAIAKQVGSSWASRRRVTT
jgi:methionine synthase I (cobalamin-dependent)